MLLRAIIKIEWLVTDVTAVEFPDRAERAILGLIFGDFGQFRPFLWPGSHCVVKEPPLEP